MNVPVLGLVPQQHVDDAFGGPAVPERGDIPLLPIARENLPRGGQDRLGAGAGKFVPISTVEGRSVFSQIVTHGTPSAVVSSWSSPESVGTSAAPFTE